MNDIYIYVKMIYEVKSLHKHIKIKKYQTYSMNSRYHEIRRVKLMLICHFNLDLIDSLFMFIFIALFNTLIIRISAFNIKIYLPS